MLCRSCNSDADKEKIEQNFGHKIEVIKTCSQQEVSQELIDQVDLVLTTAELSELKSDKIKKINLFLEKQIFSHRKYFKRRSKR